MVIMATFTTDAQDSGETPVHLGGPVSTMIHDFDGAGGPLYGTLDAGVIVSESGGASWQALPFPYEGSREIAVADDGTLVVTTTAGLALRRGGAADWSIVRAGEHYAPVIDGNGAIIVIEVSDEGGDDSLLRSTDNGTSWQPLPVASSEIETVAIGSDGTLWVRGESGIERSTDDGVTWSTHGRTPAEVDARGFVLRSDTIFLLSDTDLYSSTGADTTWTDVGDAPHDGDIRDIAAAPSGEIFVVYEDPTEEGEQVFRTSGGGVEWTPWVTPAYEGTNATAGPIAFGGIGGFDSNVILGTSFVDVDAIDPNRRVAQIYYHSGAGMPSLAFTTSPSTSYILKIDRGPEGTLYATRYPQTIPFEQEDVLLASRDSGMSWETIRPEDAEARSTTLTILEDGTALVAAGDSGLYRSTDAARTWQRVATPEGTWIPLGDVIELDDGTLMVESRVFFNRTEIYTSTDKGLTWTAKGPREEVRGAIGTAASSDGTVYIAENNTVFSSTNLGATWTNRSVASGGNYIVGITIDGDGDPVVATFNGPLYRSSDGGQSWTELESSPGEALFAITADREGRIFVANRRNQIFRSDDNGESWVIHATIPGPRMATRTLRAGIDGNLYIGTEERGVWYASLAGGRVSVEAERFIPTLIDLR